MLAGGVVVAFIAMGHAVLPWTRVEAHITPVVDLEGTTAHVRATTDLPDGAVVSYYFWHERDSENVGDFHSGSVTAQRGRFAFTADLSDFSPGTLTLHAEFGVTWDVEQPPNVLELFGSEGERLAGPQVYVESPGEPRVLIATVPFELSPKPTAAP